MDEAMLWDAAKRARRKAAKRARELPLVQQMLSTTKMKIASSLVVSRELIALYCNSIILSIF